MAKKAHQPESAPREPDDLDRLERTVKELAGNVRSLTLLMDEIRDELIYAVRNDRFNAVPDSHWRPIETAVPSSLNSQPESPRSPAPSPTPIAVPTTAPARRPSTLFG